MKIAQLSTTKKAQIHFSTKKKAQIPISFKKPQILNPGPEFNWKEYLRAKGRIK